MKISKVFGFVLCLHLGVIAVLIVQPGCRTTQPPTQTYQQDRTGGGVAQQPSNDLIPATRADVGALDPAFNAGFDTTVDDRSLSTLPADDLVSFDQQPTPQLEPIAAPPSVEVAGPSFESYSVRKGDSLWAIAKRHNVSLNELYAANGLNENSLLKIGQQIQIPVEAGTALVKTETADAYQPSGFTVATQDYTVKAGDNLSKIASRFGTTVSALKAANNKTSNVIRVGEKLIVPVDAGSSAGVYAAPQIDATQTVATGAIHTVKAGEYPATIARQYGMTTAELLAINGITDARKIQIGQKLQVSATGRPENVDSKVETVRAAVAPAPSVTASNQAPVAIRVVEADPLIESEITEVGAQATELSSAVAEVPAEDLFENVVEIPVIRMEDK